LLDSIAYPLAAIARLLAVMVSTVADLDPVNTWSLAIIAGVELQQQLKELEPTGNWHQLQQLVVWQILSKINQSKQELQWCKQQAIYFCADF